KNLAFLLIKENNYFVLAEKLNIQSQESKIISIVHENPLKIFSFGGLAINKNEKTISQKGWFGKNTKLLIIYFLLNKNGATKEQICNIFFPEGDKTRSAFHVLIKRLRDVFTSLFTDREIIQFKNNLYSFNFSIDYWWDAAQFEFLLNEARNLENNLERYEKTAEALSLYKGHFMAGMEIESWLFSTQEYYRNLAYKNFTELSNYYFSQKQFEKLLNLSDHFFNIDNCYEDACKFKMKALVSLKRKNEALQQFLILEKNLEKVLNDKPSLEMQKFKDKLFNLSNIDTLEDNTNSDLVFKNVQLQNEINEQEKAMEELKKIQLHLIQSEKMSGLNTLVAGVAHEINNPTNFVNGIAHNLQTDINDLKRFIFELAGDDADQKFVEMFSHHFEKIETRLGDISQGSARIKNIVQDLRSFSRLDEAEQKRVDIIESIMSTLRLIKVQYSKRVEFVTDFQEKRMIECYPAQLNQVFMNIIINSCQAIQIKQDKTNSETLGKLIIKTFLKKDNSDKEEFLGIEFRDNGIGIPENIKNKIFDPFFTTKDVGDGKGMGLSITYSIIEKHQGTIEVKSELGVGTSITLYLPLIIKNNIP
ncbi:MAG: ATP-binding protein, partial [Cyanobacteriota bacterium]